MRRALLLLGLVAGVAIASSAQAQNYPWCAQYSGRWAAPRIAASSVLTSAWLTVRGIGGFCVVNNRYQPAVSPAPRRGASGRHGSVP